jgi:hypothetical protein
VADLVEDPARETIARPVGKHSMWAFGQKTRSGRGSSPATAWRSTRGPVGVVAVAEVATVPEDKPMPGVVKDPMKDRWTFAGRDPGKMWAWFVFATRLITQHDFTLLTGGQG